jgi:hypothetical protein
MSCILLRTYNKINNAVVILIEEFRTLCYDYVLYDDFEISNYGKLRNIKTSTYYKTRINNNGYECVVISLGSRKKKKMFRIHRCVAWSFLNKPEGKNYVNHIDGNRVNNKVENLEWCTASENNMHAYKRGKQHHPGGQDNPFSKLSEADVFWILDNYKPRDRQYGCRAIARKFGICHVTIVRLLQRKVYIKECKKHDDLYRHIA